MPRDIPITRLRNIGIMAHIDAGKTTCAERILFVAGRIHATGEVHDGDTVLDFDPFERQHGITIHAAATSVSWKGHRIQLVDTPGHVDFTIEVERALRVLDGAVFVLDASQGVECQSETVFRQAERHGVPSVAFVNKIDKVGADFEMCLADVRERLGVTPVAVHWPVGEATSDVALLDVVGRSLLRFDEATKGRTVTSHAVPRELAARLEAARRVVVEACAEFDDEVLVTYCEGRDVPADVLVRALRAGTLARRWLVVTCGSALRNIGIPTLLDAVVAFLPSPADVPAAAGETPDTGAAARREPTDDAPLSALAFKTVADRAGHLTYLRIYSGVLETGAQVSLGVAGTDARVGRIYLPHADTREEVASAGAGAVVAVIGLREARTGETIAARSAPIVFERVAAPEPVVEAAIVPKTSEDRERLSGGLARLTFDDPSLRARVDEETGEMRLRGMGQLHLEVAVDKLLRDHRVAVSLGRPRVAYRETIARAATTSYRHIQQTGGPGQFACVTLAVAPLPRGSGIVFSDETAGGVVPREYVPAVEEGIRGAASRGVFAGWPIVDVRASLTDGEAHSKDSSAAAFTLAGSRAFQQACRAAGLVLLEPYAAVEATVPESHGGDVIGDLAARRGILERTVVRGRALVICARVPMGETFDYVSHLRGLTRGRGTAVVRADEYRPAPESVVRAVIGS
jgi:elongation factor G